MCASKHCLILTQSSEAHGQCSKQNTLNTGPPYTKNFCAGPCPVACNPSCCLTLSRREGCTIPRLGRWKATFLRCRWSNCQTTRAQKDIPYRVFPLCLGVSLTGRPYCRSKIDNCSKSWEISESCRYSLLKHRLVTFFRKTAYLYTDNKKSRILLSRGVFTNTEIAHFWRQEGSTM